MRRRSSFDGRENFPADTGKCSMLAVLLHFSFHFLGFTGGQCFADEEGCKCKDAPAPFAQPLRTGTKVLRLGRYVAKSL